MKPRPKPLLGLLLGVLLGAVIVGLLWQLGVAPPDRFILFGVIGVAIALVELLMTQTTRRGKKRFVTVMIIAGVFGGVALTGIPEVFMNKGTVSDGCTLEVTSGDQTVNASDTSAFDPLDTTPTGTLDWTSSTDKVLTDWHTALGMYIGGIPLELWTAERANSEQATSWHGSEDVADYLQKLEDESGLQLRGTYHVYGYIHADEGDCEMAAYIRVNAENPFATPLIIALWVAGGLLVIVVISIAVSVRRSIRDAKAFAASEAASANTPSGSMATGGSAAPDMNADPEPIGAFTDPPAEEPEVAQPQETVTETQVMPTAETEALPVTEPEPVSAEQTSPEPTSPESPAPASDEEPKAP